MAEALVDVGSSGFPVSLSLAHSPTRATYAFAAASARASGHASPESPFTANWSGKLSRMAVVPPRAAMRPVKSATSSCVAFSVNVPPRRNVAAGVGPAGSPSRQPASGASARRTRSGRSTIKRHDPLERERSRFVGRGPNPRVRKRAAGGGVAFLTRAGVFAGMGDMRLTVQHLGKGSAMECRTPQGATITFDDPDEGTHGGSPMQHLLSAIGACALMDVDTILRKKRLTFSNLRVECVGGRREDPFPRVFTGVKLTFRVEGDVPPNVFLDVVKLASTKYCSVAGTVREGAGVDVEAIVG